jgi:hypothetical protein
VAPVDGGAGGTGGAGGDLRYPGQTGGYGVAFIVPTIAGITMHLPGGSTVFGSGGTTTNVSSSAGANATGYGAGGGAAVNGNSQVARAGGNGTAGIVVITEYTT